MKTTRTLTLEFVRHGPPHNQLLSPITEYLALCGNHGATSVFLPFEHHEFMLRLAAMRYQELQDRPEEARVARAAHAREMGNLMSIILSSVPGLKADLGGGPQNPEELVHLRLVMSAAELALLPFESALVPPGSPGASQPLSLQTTVPMSLTRQVRRAFTPRHSWPSKPRILCVISDAGGTVPAKEHVMALRSAIAPWVRPVEGPNANATNVGELLTVLTEASLEKIRQACAEKLYTHVHFLAHGRAYEVAGGTRFGLALNDATDPSRIEVVDGERLALALRTHHGGLNRELSHPAVVTVASCDSGNVDTVIAPGASLAHALHEAEIPLVVASQFPLTFEGSLVMTHVLYSRLLWGGDPRVVLHEVRQQLKLLKGEIHDWASVVAYTSFPPDFDSQLWNTQVSMADDAAESALARSGSLLSLLTSSSSDSTLSMEKIQERLTTELGTLTLARDRLLATLSEERPREQIAPEIYGRCGSIEKRRAQIQYTQLYKTGEADPQHDVELELRLHATLEKSKAYYWKGLQQDLSSQWLATQYLTLCWLLEGKLERRWWRVAEAAARVDLESPDKGEQLWAHGSLIELYLLFPFIESKRPSATDTPGTNDPAPGEDAKAPPHKATGLTPDKATQRARKHMARFVELVDRNSFPLLSTRRQFDRHLNWFIPSVREQLRLELHEERGAPTARTRSLQRRRQALDTLETLVRDFLGMLPAPPVLPIALKDLLGRPVGQD